MRIWALELRKDLWQLKKHERSMFCSYLERKNRACSCLMFQKINKTLTRWIIFIWYLIIFQHKITKNLRNHTNSNSTLSNSLHSPFKTINSCTTCSFTLFFSYNYLFWTIPNVFSTYIHIYTHTDQQTIFRGPSHINTRYNA